MNANAEKKMSMTFSSYDEHTSRHHSFSSDYDSVAPWYDIMEDFITFLSTVYGYNIREHIEIDLNPMAIFYEDEDIDFDNWTYESIFTKTDKE